MGWLAGSLGDIGFRLGTLEESERLQREALELAKTVGDEPLRGMRLNALAFVVLFRGRIEEAEAIFLESVPVLHENPEPQSQIFIPQFEGYLALARGDNGSAAVSFSAMIEQLRRSNLVQVASEVFPDLVRALRRAGRGIDAVKYRDLSEHGRWPAARANASLVDGMLADDAADARRFLADGVTVLEDLGLRVDAARAMGDLARAMARVGEDPVPVLDRARNILLECDARAFLFEVEEGYGR
jgi:hypothetical protein